MSSKPHGGKLVNKVLSKDKVAGFIEDSDSMPSLSLNHDDFLELRNIGEGVFSPLQGFMTSSDFNSVISSYRLSNECVWTIPIVLSVSKKEAGEYSEGDDIILVRNSVPVGVLHLEDKYKPDMNEWCMSVYGTIDKNHPGVSNVFSNGGVLLGGSIDYFNNAESSEHRLSPKEARELFRQNGWRTIAAFQTRNAPHRAHEYLQKTALEVVDGLFVHPLIGKKKKGDYRNNVIVSAYDLLVNHYYPANSMVFGVLTTMMHYAGPVEAVHHAIMRKNHGCTHFIVGRDHAGVGDYYQPFAAHDIFNDFPELGITPVRFGNAFYCSKCDSISTSKTCPHSNEHHLIFSGTRIRKMLRDNTKVPDEMMRPEIYDYLKNNKDLYVD